MEPFTINIDMRVTKKLLIKELLIKELFLQILLSLTVKGCEYYDNETEQLPHPPHLSLAKFKSLAVWLSRLDNQTTNIQ